MHITTIAIMITRKAATTGTTKLRLAKISLIASSAVNSGKLFSRGAIVPETTKCAELGPTDKSSEQF